MKREWFRKGSDVALILLCCVLPVCASAYVRTGFSLSAIIGRTAAVSASLSMPSAALENARNEMKAMLSDDEEAPAPENSAVHVEPAAPSETSTPEPPAVYDEQDIQAASQLIPPERRGAIETTQFASNPTGEIYWSAGASSVRNNTEYSLDEVAQWADAGFDYGVKLGSPDPQVLVVHTHSTESFDRFDAGFYDREYPSRSTDSQRNIVAAGSELCAELESLGIKTVHALEYHDYPSYNNSYSRSAETIKKYLAENPSIKIVIDMHRDGIEREDGTRVKPTASVNGEKVAQMMVVAGAGDDTDAVPNFRENLAAAYGVNEALETLAPGVTRPLLFTYRHYNQDLGHCSMLVEMGSHANTLGEAKRSARLLGQAIANACKN